MSIGTAEDRPGPCRLEDAVDDSGLLERHVGFDSPRTEMVDGGPVIVREAAVTQSVRFLIGPIRRGTPAAYLFFLSSAVKSM